MPHSGLLGFLTSSPVFIVLCSQSLNRLDDAR
jgi:hypothetical protein